MNTLQADKRAAVTAYRNSGDEVKSVLAILFGSEIFSQKVTDRVKTFEDACAENGTDPNDPRFSQGTPDEIAYKKLKEISRALNEGKKLSFADSNQRKWYPWFVYEGSGFRFNGAFYALTNASSAGGSRLCVHSSELAQYLGTQFIDLFNQFMLTDRTEDLPF